MVLSITHKQKQCSTSCSLLVILQMNTYWCVHKMKTIQWSFGFPSSEYIHCYLNMRYPEVFNEA